MNFSFNIFGTPSGYDQYPSKINCELLKVLAQNRQGSSQFSVYRNGRLVHYIYIHELSNPSNYFGIYLTFNGVYCCDMERFFAFFTEICDDIVFKQKLLKSNKGGRVFFSTRQFKHQQQEIDRLRTLFQERIDNDYSKDFIPFDNSFVNNEVMAFFSICEGNSAIIDAIRKYTLVTVTQKEITGTKKRAIPEIATRSKTIKPPKWFMAVVIGFVLLIVGGCAWNYLHEKAIKERELIEKEKSILLKGNVEDLRVCLYGGAIYLRPTKGELDTTVWYTPDNDTTLITAPFPEHLEALIKNDSLPPRCSYYLYTGKMQNGFPDGSNGKAIYDCGLIKGVYQGGFIKGLKNDVSATFTYNNGNIYAGRYENDIPHDGTYTWEDVDEGITVKHSFRGTLVNNEGKMPKPYNGMHIWNKQGKIDSKLVKLGIEQ